MRWRSTESWLRLIRYVRDHKCAQTGCSTKQGALWRCPTAPPLCAPDRTQEYCGDSFVGSTGHSYAVCLIPIMPSFPLFCDIPLPFLVNNLDINLFGSSIPGIFFFITVPLVSGWAFRTLRGPQSWSLPLTEALQALLPLAALVIPSPTLSRKAWASYHIRIQERCMNSGLRFWSTASSGYFTNCTYL